MVAALVVFISSKVSQLKRHKTITAIMNVQALVKFLHTPERRGTEGPKTIVQGPTLAHGPRVLLIISIEKCLSYGMFKITEWRQLEAKESSLGKKGGFVDRDRKF